MKTMQEDQAIAEIREVRRRISEECNHDPRTLITYYKELQLRHKERLLRRDEGKEDVADDLVEA
jgi:hypothetical protein